MFTTNCASVSPLPPRTRLNTAHPQKPLAVRHFQYITVGRRWNRNTVLSGGDSATTEAYDAITIESGLGRSPQPGGVFEMDDRRFCYRSLWGLILLRGAANGRFALGAR